MKLSHVYIIVVGLFGILIYLSLKPPKIGTDIRLKKNLPDFIFHNVRLSHFDGDRLQAEFYADFASINRNKQPTILSHVEGNFYVENKLPVHIRSPHMAIFMDQSRFLLLDSETSVTLNNQKLNLQSDELEWNSFDDIIRGRGNIILRSKTLNLVGESLRLDIKDQTLVISDNIKANIFLDLK